MRSIFPFGLVLLLVPVVTNTLRAQPSGPPGIPDSVRVEQTLSEMRSTVHLTDEQVPKIRTILMESNAATRRIRASGEMDRQALRDMMRATDERIHAVLTSEQWPAYEKYREERRRMMRNRMRDMQEKQQ
jgi:hypothetical protein